MPFMTGNVVSKWLRQILCNLELDFVFFTPLRLSKPEPVTGSFLVSTVPFHTVKYGTHHIFFLMSVKLIKYHLVFLRQYMLHTELTY